MGLPPMVVCVYIQARRVSRFALTREFPMRVEEFTDDGTLVVRTPS
ncbi:MAG: hypothetical protein ACHQ4F_10615 [Candidatus Dormibacteria bacterium]